VHGYKNPVVSTNESVLNQHCLWFKAIRVRSGLRRTAKSQPQRRVIVVLAAVRRARKKCRSLVADARSIVRLDGREPHHRALM